MQAQSQPGNFLGLHASGPYPVWSSSLVVDPFATIALPSYPGSHSAGVLTCTNEFPSPTWLSSAKVLAQLPLRASTYVLRDYPKLGSNSYVLGNLYSSSGGRPLGALALGTWP